MDRCQWCSKVLPVRNGRGRSRRYCNDACQQEAYRYRHGEEKRNILLRNNHRLDLIFCAGNTRSFLQIAYEAGYLLGVRSDCSAYDYPIQFVDNEFRKPEKWQKHVKTVKIHKPKYATIPDLSEKFVSNADIERAMKQYEQLSGYCEIPLITPHLPGQIAMLPEHVAIGYSVPTSYAGARYELSELKGRRVHILGGSPYEQMEIFKALAGRAEVMSADGNAAMNVARNWAQYWDRGWIDHPEKGVKLPDGSNKPVYLECWKWSCRNIKREWSRLVDVSLEVQQSTLWEA